MFGLGETFFEIANGGEVLVECVVVFSSDGFGDGFGLFAYEVHDGLAVFDASELCLFLFFSTFEEKFCEESGGSGFGGDAYA